MEYPLQAERFKQTLNVNPNYRPVLHRHKVKLFKTQDHQVHFEDYNWFSSLVYVVPKFKPQNFKSTVYVFPRDGESGETGAAPRPMSGDDVTGHVVRQREGDVIADTLHLNCRAIVPDGSDGEALLVNGVESDLMSKMEEENNDKLKNVIEDVYINKKGAKVNPEKVEPVQAAATASKPDGDAENDDKLKDVIQDFYIDKKKGQTKSEVQGTMESAVEAIVMESSPSVSMNKEKSEVQENDDKLKGVIEDIYIHKADKGKEDDVKPPVDFVSSKSIPSTATSNSQKEPERKPSIFDDIVNPIKSVLESARQSVIDVSKTQSKPKQSPKNQADESTNGDVRNNISIDVSSGKIPSDSERSRQSSHAVKSPAVKSPTVISPTVKSPAVKSPAVKSPAVKSPAVTSSSVTSPAVTSPAVKSPAVKTPAVTSPDVTSPAVTSPAVISPAMKSPAVKSPDEKFRTRKRIKSDVLEETIVPKQSVSAQSAAPNMTTGEISATKVVNGSDNSRDMVVIRESGDSKGSKDALSQEGMKATDDRSGRKNEISPAARRGSKHKTGQLSW